MVWEGHIYFVEESYNDLHFIANLTSQIIADMGYMIVVYVFEEGYLDYFALMPIKDEVRIIYSFFRVII